MNRGSAFILLVILASSSTAHAEDDLRPEAAAILEAAADHGDVYTLGDARAQGLAPAHATGVIAYEMPATIRVWRRGLDGSTASCSGRVDVIPFEQYVKGVLPHEWIRSWREESLKAGAVAIRTYAAWWVNAGGKYSCADLDDTTASQVYKDEFFDNTNAAVDATAGQMVIRDGELVFAEYSAENSDPTAFGVDEPHCSGQAVFGHGRGTCQWGTQRWAIDGKTYEWMMAHYYPGAVVEGIDPVWDGTLAGQEVRTTLVSGEEMVVWLEFTNDGNQTWDPSSVFVGTAGPRDRESAFYKAENWVSPSRPTGVDHSDQGPGTTARFTWAMVAPEVDETTTFEERFELVAADGTWFGGEVTWSITVTPRDGDPDPDPVPEPEPEPGSAGCNTGGGGALGPLALAVLLLVLRRRAGACALALAALLGGCDSPEVRPVETARAPLGGDSALVAIFEDAAAEHGVPAELLATISYTETRLRFAGAYRAADGEHPGHTHAGAIGLLALTEGAPRDVARAAALAGLDEARVHTEDAASVQAAAALLAELHTGTWRDALIAFGGGGPEGASFADEVAARMRHGWTGKDAAGATVTLSATEPTALLGDGDGFGTAVQALGYPGAIWNPAYSGNYSAASRGAAQINYIVIHTVQGSYNGCISWFKNPSAQVSAHYVVRSSDGQITQMVDDSDVAWHDACFNSETIGIEHEGYVAEPDVWYTENMYAESAKLTAWLADQYGIPKDRNHIFGHGEAPDCSSHTDPGGGWNWDHYMNLVQTGGLPQFGAASAAQEAPTVMRSGEEAVVWFEFENQSNVTWGLDETRLGTQEPQDRASPFYVEGNWLGPNRPTGADHSNYGPGSIGRFTFAIRAPEVTETTTFEEAYQLVQEGVTWFGPTVRMSITVMPREDGGEDPDPFDDTPGPANDGVHGDEDLGGGCAAGGGGAPGCAILLLGALAFTLRRRR